MSGFRDGAYMQRMIDSAVSEICDCLLTGANCDCIMNKLEQAKRNCLGLARLAVALEQRNLPSHQTSKLKDAFASYNIAFKG